MEGLRVSRSCCLGLGRAGAERRRLDPRALGLTRCDTLARRPRRPGFLSAQWLAWNCWAQPVSLIGT